MSRYRFELATPADDADLRRILAATPMQGSLAISFRREPSYFEAAVVEGRFRQVVAARDTHTGHLVGFGARSISERFVHGEAIPIGYLSSLRLLAEHRSLGLVARGYRFFRQLHEDDRTQLYLTTIAADNRAAFNLLTSGRAGLPRYLPIGDFHTTAIPVRRIRPPARPPDGIEIRAATEADFGQVVQFLHAQGSQRQFFPRYAVPDFKADGLLRGIRLDDLRLAIAGGELVGCMGLWDQRGFRQTFIDRLPLPYRLVRPFVNVAARILDTPRLPLAGHAFRAVYAALPIVCENRREVFHALVRAVASESARFDSDYLLLGMHASDPLWPFARELPGPRYSTRLFLVSWQDGDGWTKLLDDRPIYLELGAL